jgi:hypothetical protein
MTGTDATKDNIPPDKHHFTCLPYINLGKTKEIDFGFAKIWNFDLAKEEYIPDEKLRAQVEKTLRVYKGSYPYGREDKEYLPIHGIGIVSTDASTKQEPDKIERQKINDARLILFISMLERQNTGTVNVNSGHWMLSSENFQPIYFSTVVGSEHFSSLEGFVIANWHGGLDFESEMVIRPRYVPTPTFGFDNRLTEKNKLMEALVELRSKKPKTFRRVISAVEVFFESYYNAHQVSHNARILLQATAFEILLNLSEDAKARKEFKTFLKKEATYPEDKQITFISEQRGKKVRETGTIREKWADSFFTLRNNIIHGHVPVESEYIFGKWQRHFDIALYFFLFCLQVKIEKAMRRQMCDCDVLWKTWTDDLNVTPNTNKVID